MRAAKAGRRVAVVERAKIGGACTHSATIPSKALRHSVGAWMSARNHPLFAEALRGVSLSFAQLVRAAEPVIQKQVAMRSDFYSRNDVMMVHGEARFVDAHTLEVHDGTGVHARLEADAFVIATGSRPYRPADIDFSHPRVRDSDTILSLGELAKAGELQTMTIYGAGVVGCEYASIFRNLGVKVNLINSRDRLLSFLDDEITDALSYHLRDQGVLIRHNEEYAAVEATDEGVTLTLRSGKRLRSDLLLWAQGRTGNVEGLELESVGIKPDSRGCIAVDNAYRSAVPHIFAVGDVIGRPSLASASYDQGRAAAAHWIGADAATLSLHGIPTGIYTSPEISSLGKTERELTAECVPYEVGHSLFRSLARAQITGNTVGMLKILFHRDTRAILGIHCFGDQAAEIVHIGQAIMSQSGEANSLDYFVNTTFNYPTMAEAYRVAALNGLNRL